MYRLSLIETEKFLGRQDYDSLRLDKKCGYRDSRLSLTYAWINFRACFKTPIKENNNIMVTSGLLPTYLPTESGTTQPLCTFFVTTQTQPQLNSKVGFDTKMNLDSHHHKLKVINISAVPDPILPNFWDSISPRRISHSVVP